MTDLVDEIRQRDASANGKLIRDRPNSAIADRRTLLRLLDATREELADALGRIDRLNARMAECDDEPITDSLTYVTAGEDAKTTALREEIDQLAGERNQAIRQRDVWEARTRKLLGERSGRLALEALDASGGIARRISPINGCTETTCGCLHVGSCRD